MVIPYYNAVRDSSHPRARLTVRRGNASLGQRPEVSPRFQEVWKKILKKGQILSGGALWVVQPSVNVGGLNWEQVS